MQITLAHETIYLLPERAVYWPRERTLIVADLHIGKDDVFRARGIPIPRGSVEATLARLTRAMERAFQCSGVPTAQLIVLGDFLHARESANADTLHAFTRWRRTQPTLSIVVVEGNHDRHAGTAALAAQWGIEMRAEPHWVKPFAFRHEACARAVATGADFDPAESQYEFAGHVHPCTVLSGRVDRLRVPCYVLGPAAGLLPAFGAFTGGYVVAPSSDQAIYAIAGERVLKVPTAQQPQRA